MSAVEQLKDTILEELKPVLATTLSEGDIPEVTDGLRGILSTFHVNTLRRMQSVMDSRYAAEFAGLINYDKLPEDTVNDWCALIPLVESMNTGIIAGTRYLYSPPFYESLTPQQKGSYPEERVAQITALVRVTRYLEKKNVPTTNRYRKKEGIVIECIYDKALSTFITTHRDPERVADIIIERDTTDLQLITEILEGAHEAISSGVL